MKINFSQVESGAVYRRIDRLLGLPDALLGSAWPFMYREFGVPVSYAGADKSQALIGVQMASA